MPCRSDKMFTSILKEGIGRIINCYAKSVNLKKTKKTKKNIERFHLEDKLTIPFLSV